MKCHFTFLFLCSFLLFSQAQQPAEHPPLLRVYLDQFGSPNSVNYLKTAVEFVNFTAKPTDCDVRVQLTQESVGNDIRRYLLYFYGEKRFAGQNDTTECTLPPMLTSLVLENQLVETFKQGLLPYLMQTEWADRIQFSVDSSRVNPLFQDSWNRSTFMVSTNGQISRSDFNQYFQEEVQGEQRFRSVNANIRLAWWHIGQRWRLSAESGCGYAHIEDSRRFLPATVATIIETKSNTFNGSLNAVRRLTERLSAGGFLSFNWQDQLRAKPQTLFNPSLGVEYSLLPYADFFRHRFLIGYYLGLQRHSNTFNLSPTAPLPNHQLLAHYAQRTRKAYFSADAGGNIRLNSQYWHAWGAFANANMGFEVKRNLFITLNVRTSATNDRPLSELTSSLSGLFTNKAREYGYSTSIGLTWLLGSGYRNILNPGLVHGTGMN